MSFSPFPGKKNKGKNSHLSNLHKEPIGQRQTLTNDFRSSEISLPRRRELSNWKKRQTRPHTPACHMHPARRCATPRWAAGPPPPSLPTPPRGPQRPPPARTRPSGRCTCTRWAGREHPAWPATLGGPPEGGGGGWWFWGTRTCVRTHKYIVHRHIMSTIHDVLMRR